MAVASPETVDWVEQRAELKAVLESEEFVRAPTLAQLLGYLCERLFAGEISQIKEYSIGVEVFRRGERFDQDADSIVRVEANRLRKRLARYYAGPGAGHALQITIPIGQYVPSFAVKHEPAALSVAPPALSPTPDAQKQSRLGPLRRGVVWAVASVLLLLVAGSWWRSVRHDRISAPPAEPSPVEQVPEAQFGPPIGEEVRILAGESRSMVDHAGKLWSADAWFTGGEAVKSAVQHIWRTQDQAFYRVSRQGQFRYDIPLKKGIYELRLHFAETVYGPESTGTGGEGDRILTVRANGKTLLAGFDVAADAGASRTADVKVFPEIRPAEDGKLHLEFAGEAGKQATLAAIEILPGLRGRMRPVHILPRQTPYYSNDSQWWSPDNFFEGGQLATYPEPVRGTDDPELYESERWGNFTYAIPVAPGRYALTLRFAARHPDANGQVAGSEDGARGVAHVFDVYCNGKVLLQRFDLAREAGQTDVVIRRFGNLEPNAQGKLLLSFVPVEGYATVSGIEVTAQ